MLEFSCSQKPLLSLSPGRTLNSCCPSPPKNYYLGTGALKGPLRTYYLGTWGARVGSLFGPYESVNFLFPSGWRALGPFGSVGGQVVLLVGNATSSQLDDKSKRMVAVDKKRKESMNWREQVSAWDRQSPLWG